jgi:uncharacterized protein (TIGR03085 family)
MTRERRMAQLERSALCDTALAVGEDAPTLCGGWDVKDLVVHLLVREGSPAAAGIVLPPLAGWTEAASRRVGRRDFAGLVERLRSGPPRWSPYAVPKVDALANTLEMYVHHEDLRRARPGWTARTLPEEQQRLLWSMLRTAGRALSRRAPVGVVVEDATSGATAVLRAGEPAVTVRGLPGELVLHVFGRGAQAEVERLGDPGARALLDGWSPAV